MLYRGGYGGLELEEEYGSQSMDDFLDEDWFMQPGDFLDEDSLLLEFDDGNGNSGTNPDDEDEDLEDMGDDETDDTDADDGPEDYEDEEEVETMDDTEGQEPDTLNDDDDGEEYDDVEGMDDDGSVEGEVEADPASEEPAAEGEPAPTNDGGVEPDIASDTSGGDDMNGEDEEIESMDDTDTGEDGDDTAADNNEGGGEDDLDDGEDEEIETMDAGDGEGDGNDGEDGEGEDQLGGGNDSGLGGDASNTDPQAKLKELENQIFDTLSPEEKEQRIKLLKSQYISISTSCDVIIKNIIEAPKSDSNIQALDKCQNTLTSLKAYVRDYTNNIYDSKPYTANLVNYEHFLSVFGAIRDMMDVILTIKEKEDKE